MMMSNRHIPIKFVMVSLAGLAALAVIPISDDDRKLLLIGWTLLFFGVLALWQQNELPAYRPAPSSSVRHIQPPGVEELYDLDRAELQHGHHVWNDPTSGSSKEIV